MCILREPQTDAPNLPGLSSLWRPGAAMVSILSNESARSSAVALAYEPYPNPDLAKSHGPHNKTPIGFSFFRAPAARLFQLSNPIYLPQRRRKLVHRGRPRCAG